MSFEKALKIFNGCFSHPSHETVTHVLRHCLVFLELLEKNVSMEVANILEISEYHMLLSFQCCWHI